MKADENTKVKVSIAFGGGGAKALAHIGVFKVLREHKIPIHSMATCSAGSLVGAMLAMGLGEDRIMAAFAKTLQRISWFRPTLSRKAFLSQRNFRNILGRVCGDTDLSETKIPLQMVATDLAQGTLKVFDRGPLKELVVASSAFPGMYKPVTIEGHTYVDGGLLDSIPADICRANVGEEGLVIAVTLDGQLSESVQKANIFGILYRAIYIPLIHNREKTIADNADVVIKVFDHHEFNFKNWKDIYRFYSVAKMRQFVQLGEEAARQALPSIQAKIAEKEGAYPTKLSPIRRASSQP